MEDVLDVYKRPLDPTRPVVCFDEATKQLVADVTSPLPARPGQCEKVDYEYERRGTANIFMQVEPLAGKRFVDVTDQRCAKDFAEQVRRLVDERYPAAKTIVLVMDNLNTHAVGSLYETFAPREARRLAMKIEIHYTPKHGSWLNMAELEFSALSRQCLDRRFADKEALSSEVRRWQTSRNREATTIDWHFGIGDARRKLRRLYPSYTPRN
jgi:transposase